jgi:peptide/nickel transport system substrate-binding protein
VRHAITYALDIDAILANAFAGTGNRLTSPVTSLTHYAIEMEPFEQDLDRARELLAEAGYPDGFPVRFWVNTGNQARLDVAEMAQNQLRQVGIEVSIEVVEWATYLERIGNAEHEMYMLGWVGGPDPDYHLYTLFHSVNRGSAGNGAFLNDPEVDRLLEAGRTELDMVRRAQIYAELQMLLRDIRPHIFLYQSEELNITTPDVRGFYSSPDVLPRFWEVYFE